jgi:tRNA threonylcarbamoyl adenosine modification protein (Sua5/YciO/YrdC/YwlC family)
MPILPATGDPAPEALRTAIDSLADGLVVGVPTDTVYGLAVDPFRPGATARLFAAKRRPRGVPLPVLVGDVEQAKALTSAAEGAPLPPVAAALMNRFWPGPLTIVLPRRPGLAADLGDDEDTVGVRWPDHRVVQALCAKIGPLATTSANRHGEATPLTAGEVADVFGEDVALVLDGGPCAGAPSTVVDCTGPSPRLLREGRIPWDAIQAAAKGATP